MKKIVMYICLLIFSNALSQVENKGTYIGGANTSDYSSRNLLNFQKILNKKKTLSELKGKTFLFENWNNSAKIYIGEKKIELNNINYDVITDNFITETNKDSTLIFDLKGIDKLIINNITFKAVYNPKTNENKVHHIIYQDKKNLIIRDYYIQLTEGSVNPMVNRPKGRIKIKSNIYFVKNGDFIKLKRSKKSILKLVGSDKINKFEKFVKNNKLSYKKDKDINRMFNYLSQINLE